MLKKSQVITSHGFWPRSVCPSGLATEVPGAPLMHCRQPPMMRSTVASRSRKTKSSLRAFIATALDRCPAGPWWATATSAVMSSSARSASALYLHWPIPRGMNRCGSPALRSLASSSEETKRCTRLDPSQSHDEATTRATSGDTDSPISRAASTSSTALRS